MKLSQLLDSIGVVVCDAHARKMDDMHEYNELVHDIDIEVEAEMQALGVEPLEGRA